MAAEGPGNRMIGYGLIALAAMCALAGLHPFTTYPLSLMLAARLRPRALQTGSVDPLTARVALCVCAYNEEGVIADKIANMLSLRAAMPTLEILVYVDAATDRTAEILQRHRDDIRVVVSHARHGKTHGMNRLVAMTTADYVVFSDANVMFAADAIQRLIAPFGDSRVGCVCGHLIYGGADNSATAATGSLYWALEERIKELETQTGSTMGADGSIFAIRRHLHTPPPDDVIDDMFVSLSILCSGYRVVRTADALAHETTVSRPGEEFRRKVRIGCQAFNVHRQLWPRLARLPPFDIYKYLSHKWLRWQSVFFLAAAGICGFAGLAALHAWTLLSVVAGIAAISIAAAVAAPGSVFGRALEAASALWATGLGVVRSLQGDRFQTWTPPASARGGA